jgi:hypothetical protein
MSRPTPHQPSDHHPEHEATLGASPRPMVGPPNEHELAIMIWIAVSPRSPP